MLPPFENKRAQIRKLVRCFAVVFTVRVTSEMTGISLRSVNTVHLKTRQRPAEACEQASHLNGAVEVDESYFGVRQVRGRRGHGAQGNTKVFRLHKRQGMFYTESMTDHTKSTLQVIMWNHIDPATVIHAEAVLVTAVCLMSVSTSISE